MTKIINLTPHEVTIVNAEGRIIERIPASGQVARLTAKTVKAAPICGIPVSRTLFGEVTDLPKEQWQACTDSAPHDIWSGDSEQDACGNAASAHGVAMHCAYAWPKAYYIVSQIIKNTFPERGDLLVPAEVVRDEKGNIIGCQSLGL